VTGVQTCALPIYFSPQSVLGQLIGVFSKPCADIWENQEAVYNSQYPATAEGTSLDNVVQLNGITRLPALQTSVIGVCQGVEGTAINTDSLARQPDTQEVFFCETGGVISRSNVVQAQANLDLLDEQAYSVVINSSVYTYSLPTITFTGSFVTGNSIVLTINGVQQAPILFNTDNDTTLGDIATAISLISGVDTAIDIIPSTIEITPQDGYNVVINSINISGGISQPTYTITYRIPQAIISFNIDFVTSNSLLITLNDVPLTAVPFNTDQSTTALDIKTLLEAQPEIDIVDISGSDRIFTITPNAGFNLIFNSAVTTGGTTQPTATIENPVFNKLSQIINSSEVLIEAVDNNDGTMEIYSFLSSNAFSINSGTNISIDNLYSPFTFKAQNFGTLSAPANSLTEILTPIFGWNSINNWEAGVIGRGVETDSELRIRRRNTIRLLGNATVESIRAKLLQNVDGSTAAFVYENQTMQQEDLDVIFSDDLITGNQVEITINNTILPIVNFSVDHLTTMNLIASE